MKTTKYAAAVLVCAFAWIANAGDTVSTENEKKITERVPNSGVVSDSAAALQIGKAVLSHLLTPEDFKRKEFSEAKLKDGIWIVSYWEPKTRINLPVAIHIRQKTGAIIKYEDPNA